MNKTVYLRDEEVPIWEKARELSGDKLSPIIVGALKRFVAEEEGRPRNFERIQVHYNDVARHSVPTAKAFIGKWLIPPEERWEDPFEAISRSENDPHTSYAVAITAKDNVVVCTYKSWGGTTLGGRSLDAYSSFEDALARKVPYSLIADAMDRRGIPIEELDI
jgi:hypothetical protein